MKHLKYFGTGLLVLAGIALCCAIITFVVSLLIVAVVKIWHLLLILLGLLLVYGLGAAFFHRPIDNISREDDWGVSKDPDE